MNDQIELVTGLSMPLDPNTTQRALDELFELSRQYRSGKEYFDLLQFVSRFKSYSIFNALLVHIQMPGATYIASASRWKRDYRRRIRLGARPLVILKPMGPVMFVFDVSDTEPEKNAPPLPSEVTDLFRIKRGTVIDELDQVIGNSARDGIKVAFQDAGSLKAGSIEKVEAGKTMEFLARHKPQLEWQSVPLRYGILLNAKQSKETQFASLVHELGHLYCGHLGSPNEKWWPHRSGLTHNIEELEAESVCFLVCQRLGIENPSEKYLSDYVKENTDIEKISLDCVIKAATLIEQMSKQKMPPRKIENMK